MIISFSEAFAKRQAANATRAIEFRAQLCIFLSNHANDPACDYVAPTVIEQIAQATEFMVSAAIHSHEIATENMRLDRSNFALIGEAACVVALELSRLIETSKDWKLSAQIVIERLLGMYLARDSAALLASQLIQAHTSESRKLKVKLTKEIAELAVTAIRKSEDHAVARIADLLMPEFVAVA